MRTAGVALLGLVGGVVIGIGLSEVIGVIGVLGFNRAVGIRYLPIATGVLGAVLAVIATRWEHHR